MSRYVIPHPTITPAQVRAFDKEVKSFTTLASTRNLASERDVTVLVSVGEGLSYLLNMTKDGALGKAITGDHFLDIGNNYHKMIQRQEGGKSSHAQFLGTYDSAADRTIGRFVSKKEGDPRQWAKMSEGEHCDSVLAQMMADWRAAVNDPELPKTIATAQQASSAESQASSGTTNNIPQS